MGADSMATGDDFKNAYSQLTQGSTSRLADVPKLTGGPAGVYTIWIEGQLIAVGHSVASVDVSEASNPSEADGVRGQLVGLRQQPTDQIQRRLGELFPDRLVGGSGDGESDLERSAALLQASAGFRVVTTESGPAAKQLHEAVEQQLVENGKET